MLQRQWVSIAVCCGQLDRIAPPGLSRRAAGNPIARVVKLADVTDNMDLGRISNPTDKDFDRLKEYVKVRALLEAAAP